MQFRGGPTLPSRTEAGVAEAKETDSWQAIGWCGRRQYGFLAAALHDSRKTLIPGRSYKRTCKLTCEIPSTISPSTTPADKALITVQSCFLTVASAWDLRLDLVAIKPTEGQVVQLLANSVVSDSTENRKSQEFGWNRLSLNGDPAALDHLTLQAALHRHECTKKETVGLLLAMRPPGLGLLADLPTPH